MMMTLSKNEVSDTNKPRGCNADCELQFQELYLQCQTLENEKTKLRTVKKNLLQLTENNESISQRLLKIKTEFEYYKSHLHKTLFNIKVSTDKQKILSQKKLDEFFRKTHTSQQYYKASSKINELEELCNTNRHLQKELEKKADLFKITKDQYAELVNFIMKSFQIKVCEFCDIVLRLEPANK